MSFPRPETVEALLELDASYRVPGVTGGLIPLEALEPVSWSFSHPTLVSRANHHVAAFREHAIHDKKHVIARFYEEFPQLAHISLQNLLVAGGCIASLLSDRDEHVKERDVDIFVYGLSPAEADARIAQFLLELRNSVVRDVLLGKAAMADERAKEAERLNKSSLHLAYSYIHKALFREAGEAGEGGDSSALMWTGEDVAIVPRPPTVSQEFWESEIPVFMREITFADYSALRTAGSITFKLPTMTIQFVLRLYASVSEVLHGFDVGAAAVGFDGEEVWLTALGRAAHEMKINVVDTTRRSATYEARLQKYQARGFDIVLPLLDVGPLHHSANVKYYLGQVVDLPRMPFVYTSIKDNYIQVDRYCRLSALPSEEELTDYAAQQMDDPDGYSIASHNVLELARGGTNFFHIAHGAVVRGMADILKKPPHVNVRMIHSFYGKLRGKMTEHKMSFSQFAKFFPSVSRVALLDALQTDTVETALEKAVERQLSHVLTAWEEKVRDVDPGRLPWITENPGAQLTGSFVPIWEEPEQWYGSFMKH